MVQVDVRIVPKSTQKVTLDAVNLACARVHLHKSLKAAPGYKQRASIWQARASTLGFVLETSPEGCTHLVVPQDLDYLGDAKQDITKLVSELRQLAPAVVTVNWLQDSCGRGELLPVEQYLIPAGTWDERPSKRAKLGKYEAWLGHWRPELDARKDLELIMEAKFNDAACKALGNDRIVAVLKQLSKYEEAVFVSDTQETGTQALSYSHAAASIQACNFSITSKHSEADLRALLPYIGESMATVVAEVAITGTCERLENFKQDLAVTDSHGCLRPETIGAATRRAFCKLPGVGPKTAERWYTAGFRSLEDVRLAAMSSAGTDERIADRQVAWCLQHHRDLTEDVSVDELEQMKQATLDALKVATGRDGWQMMLVGGGRRGKPAHDVDFLVYHPDDTGDGVQPTTVGLADVLFQTMVSRGRMVSREEGWCHLQTGHLARMLQHDELRADHKAKQLEKRRMLDGYDHIFGVFITDAGCYRRLDLVLTPFAQLPYATLGWTGSKQYLRFLKAYVASKNKNLMLNNHGLWVYKGSHFEQVKANCEQDIYQYLGLPYREPEDRNCP